MRILRAALRSAVPWKNGGGITREVAIAPPGAGFDDFDWRISIAEVRGAGPFSLFPGIDRTLTILDGRMRLDIEGRTRDLDPRSAPLAFPGDVACTGTPLDGPVTDLNVMTRRGRCAAQVRRIARGEATNATVIVAEAPTRIGTTRLARFDAVLVEEPCEIDGAAIVIVIA